jgi:hypothetical protein
MEYLKLPSDFSHLHLPKPTSFRAIRTRGSMLRGRLRLLAAHRKKAEKIVQKFLVVEAKERDRLHATEQEKDKLRAIRQAREALGQTSSEGTPSGVSVPPVHGGERAPEGETVQEIPINEAVTQEGPDEPTGRGTNTGSRKLVKSFYCTPRRAVLNKGAFEMYARPYCVACSWKQECPGWTKQLVST